MSLSDLLVPPNPDGAGPATAVSGPRASSLELDPSLGGATRTNADTGSTLDNLLRAVGRAVRQSVTSYALSTPQGQAIVGQARADYVQGQWNQWSPMIVIGLVVILAVMLFRRS